MKKVKQAPRYRKLVDLGDLHTLLIKCSPINDRGEQSIPTLAEKLGCSPMAIYKWIEAKKVPAKRANTLVSLSEGAVSIEDLHKYVYGE